MESKKKARRGPGGTIKTAAEQFLSTPHYTPKPVTMQAQFSPTVSALLDQAISRSEHELHLARVHWLAAQTHLKIKAALEQQFGLGGRA